MNILLILGAAVVGPAVAVALIGKSLPVQHVARARAVFGLSVDELWKRLTSFESYPSWRRGVAKVEQAGPDQWREVDKKGEAITYQTVESTAPRKLVRRIADKNLPFGGTWTFELSEDGPSRTALSITEDGQVYNPVFRFVSRFLMGHHATMKAFLEDVAKAAGEEPKIELS